MELSQLPERRVPVRRTGPIPPAFPTGAGVHDSASVPRVSRSTQRNGDGYEHYGYKLRGGRTLVPELYAATGIAGTVQHLTGIKDARFIAAINFSRSPVSDSWAICSRFCRNWKQNLRKSERDGTPHGVFRSCDCWVSSVF